MIHSYQTMSDLRLFFLLFWLITLGYSPRVGWELGSGVTTRGYCSEETSRGLCTIYFYLVAVVSTLQCSVAVALFIINMYVIMNESVVRLFVLRVLVSFIVPFSDHLWYPKTNVVSEYNYDHAHYRLLYLCDIIIYPCAVRCFKFWKILIIIHDSSTHTTSLSFGAC